MTGIPLPALIIGIAGAAPFVFGALLLIAVPGSWPGFLPSPQVLGMHILEHFGAVILGFMGGCLWGFASAPPRAPALGLLAASALPALLAFFSIQKSAPLNCLWLAFGFVVLQAIDVAFYRAGVAPDYWLHLRLPLTATVIACLLVGALYG